MYLIILNTDNLAYSMDEMQQSEVLKALQNVLNKPGNNGCADCGAQGNEPVVLFQIEISFNNAVWLTFYFLFNTHRTFVLM